MTDLKEGKESYSGSIYHIMFHVKLVVNSRVEINDATIAMCTNKPPIVTLENKGGIIIFKGI